MIDWKRRYEDMCRQNAVLCQEVFSLTKQVAQLKQDKQLLEEELDANAINTICKIIDILREDGHIDL